jgi:hypothetical protein
MSLAIALAGLAAAAAWPVAAQSPQTTPAKPAATTPAPPTPAATAPAPTNPQQERMKVCNERATGMTGDARKAFMSDCLSGKEPAKMTQQERMTACNKKAGDMKGDERKKFMSECLKT